jgi:hypothetical protein
MANRMVFLRTVLTGGGADSLDLIDGADRGDGNPLQEGDTAFVLNGGTLYVYNLDADSAEAESSPAIIRPDTNAGDMRWVQQAVAASTADIDDVPVDGETDAPISSNWAYDHVAASDPHTGYVLESLFDAYSILYADSDNTPARLTVGASTIVGRKSTGGVSAMSASEVRAIINVADGATANDMASPGAIGETTPNTIRGKNKEIFKTASADSPLTAAECCGTIVSNYGMTDADCVISLPTAAEGLAFVCILPAVRARYFRLDPVAGDSIYLSGVTTGDGKYVGVASGYAAATSASFFTFKTGASAYDWFCIPIFGTWVAEAA